MKKIAYILIAVFAFIACGKTDLSGIESDINSIENRLNNIEKTALSSINSSIAALEAAKGKTEERLSALEKDNGYGTEINNLKTQIGNLESQISELRKYAENLTQGVKEWADLKFATIESLNNALVTLSDLQKNVANLPDSNAVNQAIENALKSVTASISALEQRVDAIEKMIQSVTIIPDYADGSIKAEDGNLQVNFIVCPAEALVSIIENNYMDCIKLLVKSVETKSSGLYQEVEYDEVIILDEAEGTARLKANLNSLMPSDDEHTLSIALKVKNGISCYTTDFVSVMTTRTSYSISIENDGNGFITVFNENGTEEIDDIKHITPGTKVRLSATSNAGYEFVEWIDVFGNAGEFIKTKREIQLTMPKSDIKIKATFKVKNNFSGIFTVGTNSDGSPKQVKFANGNLYWDGYSFIFEDIQTSFASIWNEHHVSHFFWSKDEIVSYTQSYCPTETDCSDILFTNDSTDETKPNANFTANGQTGLWRTLSRAEWGYLLCERIVNGGTWVGHTYVWTTINNVNGLLIFCDDYAGNPYEINDIPIGCAFLPAAGYRSRDYISNIGGGGYYWASSTHSSRAVDGDNLFFLSSNVETAFSDARARGLSIRLVADYK